MVELAVKKENHPLIDPGVVHAPHIAALPPAGWQVGTVAPRGPPNFRTAWERETPSTIRTRVGARRRARSDAPYLIAAAALESPADSERPRMI
jgi:hypothetical protein